MPDAIPNIQIVVFVYVINGHVFTVLRLSSKAVLPVYLVFEFTSRFYPLKKLAHYRHVLPAVGAGIQRHAVSVRGHIPVEVGSPLTGPIQHYVLVVFYEHKQGHCKRAFLRLLAKIIPDLRSACLVDASSLQSFFYETKNCKNYHAHVLFGLVEVGRIRVRISLDVAVGIDVR